MELTMMKPASHPRLHFKIPKKVRQGDLRVRSLIKGRTWVDKLKSIWTIYSVIATLLFTAWLIVPAIADSQEPTLTMPWTMIAPLVESCTGYGGFVFKNELYACSPAGTLSGDLKMPPTLTVAEQQFRLRQLLPQSIWGFWVGP